MKRLLNTLCLCCAGLLALPVAAQSGYPAKPVEIVVGFPPGGGNDVLTRIVADKLQAALRQPFVVVNRPGADGIIAFDTVKRAAPDGYTLLVGPSSGMTVNPAVYAKLPYDPLADFEPISMVGGFPLFVVVPPDSPLRTLGELVAQAKQKPGDLAYGSAATSFRMATEMFAQRAGISLFHVPYQGSGKAVQAVMAREVPLSFADAAAATAQIKGGRLRALAVSTAQRVPGLPESCRPRSRRSSGSPTWPRGSKAWAWCRSAAAPRNCAARCPARSANTARSRAAPASRWSESRPAAPESAYPASAGTALR